MLALLVLNTSHSTVRIEEAGDEVLGGVDAWIQEGVVHGVTRGGEGILLGGRAVRLEVFLATAGEGGLLGSAGVRF